MPDDSLWLDYNCEQAMECCHQLARHPAGLRSAAQSVSAGSSVEIESESPTPAALNRTCLCNGPDEHLRPRALAECLDDFSQFSMPASFSETREHRLYDTVEHEIVYPEDNRTALPVFAVDIFPVFKYISDGPSRSVSSFPAIRRLQRDAILSRYFNIRQLCEIRGELDVVMYCTSGRAPEEISLFLDTASETLEALFDEPKHAFASGRKLQHNHLSHLLGKSATVRAVINLPPLLPEERGLHYCIPDIKISDTLKSE